MLISRFSSNEVCYNRHAQLRRFCEQTIKKTDNLRSDLLKLPVGATVAVRANHKMRVMSEEMYFRTVFSRRSLKAVHKEENCRQRDFPGA